MIKDRTKSFERFMFFKIAGKIYLKHFWGVFNSTVNYLHIEISVNIEYIKAVTKTAEKMKT